TWSALGSGTSGNVRALAVLPGGDVIVGGDFTTAGGVAANRIARYNPSTGVWSALGSGMNNSVSALAVLPGGDVIPGGGFITAGGNVSAYFARYAFGSPAPSISDQPASRTVCASGSAMFSVTAAGIGPFTYQWRKDTSPINPTLNPSAATATLSITSVSNPDTGSYDCIVTSTCGSVTSNAATLTVVGAKCNPADIAVDNGAPLPPLGPCDPNLVNNGVTEGDYNLFFATFFDAGAACDIANDDGSPLPPFGALATNNGVTEGDYNLFFSIYFDGCAF
ncbi:MAG: immunoglobulin domain-containing protein, partial [Phycisphaerales bacterium]|nr:immunoglobulin domain-containing protein [Phycisphaerales bacterium]